VCDVHLSLLAVTSLRLPMHRRLPRVLVVLLVLLTVHLPLLWAAMSTRAASL
jgi:hypothetical protein